MKKIFLFATIAAAGLFASCSSTDDAISDAANSGIEGADDAPQAIQIGIGNLAQMETRGTGTVGGVNALTGGDAIGIDAVANRWAGQKINVFMFTKGIEAVEASAGSPAVNYTDYEEYNQINNTTLTEDEYNALPAEQKIKTPEVPATAEAPADPYATTFNLTDISANQDGTGYLYNNREMITPGSPDNLIFQPTVEATNDTKIGEAMNADKSINYYPLSGNFDFYGYHLDDALDGTTAATYDADDRPFKKTADLWTVPFIIDGSQDLMSTKAALTAGDITKLGSATYKDFYSAKAARKKVQPVLSFNHLLSRFVFFVKAGRESAAGMVGAVPGGTYDDDTADDDNLTLPGTVKIGDEKAAATYYETKDECNVVNSTNHPDDCLNTGEALHDPVLTAVNDMLGVPQYSDGDQVTDEDAYAYNATLSATLTDLVSVGDLKTAATYYETKAECNTENKANHGGVAAGDTYDPIPAHQDFAKAVKVTSIKMKSKVKGDMAVAWKGANANLTDVQKIAWGNAAAQVLTLKERPHAKKNSDAAATYADVVRLKAFYEQDASHQTPEAVANLNTQAANLLKATISKATYTDSLTADGRDKYDELTPAQALNENLIALSPTPAKWDTTNDKAELNQVGEALIVGPTDRNDESYYLEVDIAQDLPQNWSTGATKTETTNSKLLIKKPADGWEINKSYNIILTVYSLERIEVHTVITPWDQYVDDLTVGQD